MYYNNITGYLILLLCLQCDLRVLFESHCPDSKDFIHQQLVPVWHLLEPHCTLELVPFGKASVCICNFHTSIE